MSAECSGRLSHHRSRHEITHSPLRTPLHVLTDTNAKSLLIFVGENSNIIIAGGNIRVQTKKCLKDIVRWNIYINIYIYMSGVFFCGLGLAADVYSDACLNNETCHEYCLWIGILLQYEVCPGLRGHEVGACHNQMEIFSELKLFQ